MGPAPIELVAQAGRWSFTFRVHPAQTPPTTSEAAAIAAAIVEALTMGLAAVEIEE